MAGANPRSYFLRRVIRKVIVLSLITLAALMVLSMTAARPSHLGIHEGKLAAVPDSPNCVSSMTEKPAAQAEPLDISTFEEPMAALKQSIEASIPRARLVTESENYLHYEFTSRLFRFVDDGEFLLDPQQQSIQFRSASRVGYSDLGANRKRMETIRSALSDLESLEESR